MKKRSVFTRVSAVVLFGLAAAIALPATPRSASANEPAPEVDTCYDYGLIKVCCDGGGCRIVRWPW